MAISELKTKLAESKRHIEDLKKKQAALAVRLVDVRESLPVLKIAVAKARLERQKAVDAVVLNEATPSDLQKYDEVLAESEKTYAKAQELYDVLTRETKTIENGIPKKWDEIGLLTRQCWESIADEIRSRIPKGAISDVQRLIVSSGQFSKTRQTVIT